MAIKKIASSSEHSWARIYKQQLLASKLQHKNIVKVLGYGDGRVKGYYWVEEYMLNGSLDEIIRGIFSLNSHHCSSPLCNFCLKLILLSTIC